MTAAEQVARALRERAAELAPVSRSMANKREREYCLALAEFVEAADQLRFPVSILRMNEHRDAYDAAIKRLAEVLR